MTNEILLSNELMSLQQEQGNICVSVIIPTHRQSPERRLDKPLAEKFIQKAKELLLYKYPLNAVKPLLASMDELLYSIDFTHNSEGLGLYVSPNIKKLVRFPFEVTEKIMVDDHFELRHLLYMANYASPYFVLQLSENGVRLFRGSWNRLTEIKNKKFPKKYEDDYLYNRSSHQAAPGRQTIIKSVEKDKAEMVATRLKDFFHKVDESLAEYLRGNVPLVILGTKKEMAWFEKVSTHKKSIIQKIHGNYNHLAEKQLSEIIWPAVVAHIQLVQTEMVKEFGEQIGQKHGLTGLQEIWNAATEGKAFKLLVEKDYYKPGFIATNSNRLYLRPPKSPHTTVPDAVDDLIGMVLDKNGQVFFTDNDMLKAYQHIALITRY